MSHSQDQAPPFSRSPLKTGMARGAPFILVIIPFGGLFGVVSQSAGLGPLEALAISATVVAGAAQFTALQLLSENTPAFIALISSLAVNLRMAMYSATLAPWFQGLPQHKRSIIAYLTVDQSFAVANIEFAKRPDWDVWDRFRFFLGSMIVIFPLWMISTLAGALLGRSLPTWLPIDFAIPITFLAIIGPMVNSRAHIFAALSGALFALLLNDLPYSLGLIIAGFIGMLVGAEAERRGFGSPSPVTAGRQK